MKRNLLLLLAAALMATCAIAQEKLALRSTDGSVQLDAHWFPATAHGRRPVVLGLHGCGGMLDNRGRAGVFMRRYAKYFQAEGIHFVALDSFTPRGVRSICEVPGRERTINDETRRSDVFAAMEWLASRADVDRSKIFVVGWSHGAQTLLSALDSSNPEAQALAVKPRAAVAFYPGCGKFNRSASYGLTAPLLLMIGRLDDWTPAEPCEALARKLARPGQPPIELVVYADSHHGFDSLSPVRARGNVGGTRSGTATVGGNPQALEQSHARLFEFIASHLDQPLASTHEERMRAGIVR